MSALVGLARAKGPVTSTAATSLRITIGTNRFGAAAVLAADDPLRAIRSPQTARVVHVALALAAVLHLECNEVGLIVEPPPPSARLVDERRDAKDCEDVGHDRREQRVAKPARHPVDVQAGPRVVADVPKRHRCIFTLLLTAPTSKPARPRPSFLSRRCGSPNRTPFPTAPTRTAGS